MTSLIFSDLSRCDELDRADAQTVRGGNACFKREEPNWCHPEPPRVYVPPHWNPCSPPLHYGREPVCPPGCYPQPVHVVPL
ncbi:hypothetical protein B0G69_5078 [Paraburkholderia sp. RAU2J]|uniref:hypothetical protein n=1 Tax=Paraburkholderia sp. RAU2J TaxID=1938810 RepID=UPI000EB01792|nr:hypothetical protein [Paraburkholderia sp. RAU2J]RKT21677.1 hypothetical protein B0G69_5078 [Paraburkholderia sp. RAU2J]